MNKGAKVQIRLQSGGEWLDGAVALATRSGLPAALEVDEGIPDPFAIDPDSGRQIIIGTLNANGVFDDVAGRGWELRSGGEGPTAPPKPAGRTEPASEAAAAQFSKFLEQLPNLIAYSGKRDGEEHEYMRFWAIDDAGTLRKIPTFDLMAPIERMLGVKLDPQLGKDGIVQTAAAWCLFKKPAAIVLASEAWSYQSTDERKLRAMRARFGGHTPPLVDPENRQILERDYGMRCTESLMIYGELAVAEQPVCRLYDRRGNKWILREERAGVMTMRWTGIISGRVREGKIR